MTRLNREEAVGFYDVHMALEAPGAIRASRDLIDAINPNRAAEGANPQTIRHSP